MERRRIKGTQIEDEKMKNKIKIFALKTATYYDYKGKWIKLHAGTTFYGGRICSYPALGQYSTCYGGKRIWFDKNVVEAKNGMFEELFKDN